MSTRTCIKCGKLFKLTTTRGRPRKKCYECKPTRAKPPAPSTRINTVTELRNNPHCPWCGAYPPPGETFCNPQHRSNFADKVARQQERKKIRHAEMPPRSYKSRNGSVPAQVANPIDPPIITGSCVTETVS